MKHTRKLLLAAAAIGLFLLAVVVATALLMLASEADASGSGRTAEERIVVLLVLLLVACAISFWVTYRLHERYVSAPLRMAEELAAAVAHSGLRLGEYAASELQVLGKVGNQLLSLREAHEKDVAERVREARASLEEERSRLAALMADLSQSVVVLSLIHI